MVGICIGTLRFVPMEEIGAYENTNKSYASLSLWKFDPCAYRIFALCILCSCMSMRSEQQQQECEPLASDSLLLAAAAILVCGRRGLVCVKLRCSCNSFSSEVFVSVLSKMAQNW